MLIFEIFQIDKRYVVEKSPYLINEMINIEAQLVAMGHAGRCKQFSFVILLEIDFDFDLVRMPPRLDTIENTMKLSQMMVQALWNNKSPLLQLPHIAEGHLRFFETKKVNQQTIFESNKTIFLLFSIQLNLFDNLLQWIMTHVDQCCVVLPMNSTTIL